MADYDAHNPPRTHNNPPLEDQIIIDFDEALLGHDGLLGRIDEMVVKADAAGPCTSQDVAGRYADFIKMTQAAVKVIEAEREALNRPILTAQRALKARADSYSQKVSGAGAKVRALLDDFLAEQERKRQAEERRLMVEARAAEAERQRIIAEQERVAAAAAEAERARLQAIADEEARVERVRLQAIADEAARVEAARLQVIEDERAAAEAREVKVVEVVAETVVVEAAVVEVEAAPVDPWQSVAAPIFVPKVAAKAPIRGDYGTSVSTTETWNVEVENIRQVPDAYLKHPAVIEALEKVIRPQVRAKNGIREIKGCRIFSTLGSSIR